MSNFLEVSFKRHSAGPSGEKVHTGFSGLFFNKHKYDDIDITKPFERESTKYDINTGMPYTLVERWVPCNCSDGPCELGLMNKFEVRLS
jgi:hypothetical protein